MSEVVRGLEAGARYEISAAAGDCHPSAVVFPGGPPSDASASVQTRAGKVSGVLVAQGSASAAMQVNVGKLKKFI